ncbi:hypothetical protein PHYPSEUDO_002149 [Phytophthora pseudosyringae]|uniref:Uncharacterized protein n=1 Tax=Phytophthora pseudosyringae TaxID=221518 RepID=A0A8T1V1U8_9STRA|nr:hypothetical protein PHYPSEUDO_002149 [Phytophthora pseudosyringae]
MANSASRQKANNVNNNGNGKKDSTAADNAPVKAAATAMQGAKATSTIAAAPTRDDVKWTSKTTAKNVTDNITAAKNSTAKPFALSDVAAWSMQRARQIRKADFERKANATRQQVDQWIRGALNAKTVACVQEVQETRQTLLALVNVSAAISKYGEQELARRDQLGEMDNVIGARFGTSAPCSKPLKEAERQKQKQEAAMKNGTKVQVKKDAAPKAKVQDKQVASVKNSSPVGSSTSVENAVLVKIVQPMGAWAGPLPPSILQCRPDAIVSVGGRVVLSRPR